MKQKKEEKEVFNSKLIIASILILFLLGSVLAGDVIVKEGSLSIDNNLNSSGILFVNSTSGNVGIGTTSPNETLEIISSNAKGAFAIYNSTTATPLLFVNTTTGKIGIGTTSPNTKLEVVGSLNVTGGSASTKGLYVSSYGYVGIGTISLGSNLLTIGSDGGLFNVTGAGLLRTANNIYSLGFGDLNGFGGSAYTATLCWDGSGASDIWACSSSRTLKANEEMLSGVNASDFIMKLTPKTYNPIMFGSEKENLGADTSVEIIGLIAEDVYDTAKGTIFEDLVQFDEDGKPRGIDYQVGLVTTLVKGFQEQQKEMESLKEENKLLKDCIFNSKDFDELKICAQSMN